ncbi:GGDEF domain-containing phosphodiesterase [uncultured Ruminococcus sp.]|uniref:GGDEF domain-containing phosphodiesterase n=1 Tax=uncultured Ruminococcus sp. TaxID=165186 RepID=UPI002603D1AB|nr:GGDEF domain-containing phosphodiesterase [uncultured Ruminococcus sp.]
MSIFDFSKTPPALSHDWQVFQQFVGNIGAFTYIAKEKAAYLDAAACHMLGCPSEKINEFEFFNLLEKISKCPVEGQKHIYKFTDGNTSRYIKMNIYESSDEWLGFVQDFTRQITDINDRQAFVEYDPVTRLPSYPSFSQKIKNILPETQHACLATIYINGIDKLGSYLTVDNTNSCITSVAEALKGFASDTLIIGSKSNYEICVFFRDCDKMSIYNILNSMDEAVQNCILTDDFGEIIDISDKSRISLSIGCASFPEEASDFNMLVNYSEFALFEARTDKRSVINWFSEENYVREKDSYRNAQTFSRIVQENLLTYYLQPIVETHTGEIVAYEALMRTVGDIKMPPKQILKIADAQNDLYAVEKLTFFNTLKLLSDNQQIFENRKLFINCLPNHLLSDEDFNELYLTYGELLEKTVIEIVEESASSAKGIETLKKRCGFARAMLAIDDYGTGYSNSSNLLHYSPDYIKIDRSLISDIHNDLKKQQLVTAVIEFCHDNQLKSLAEGVETLQELKTVIRLGVDLVQGYYTSKPKPLFLNSISADIKDEIIKTNLETRPDGVKKIYAAQNDTEVDLLKLALEKYTDIHVYQSKLTIVGDPDKPVKMNISVMDNHSCELTLKNVNMISGNSKPTISVGEYARLVLNVVKNNKLGYSGIYVPMGSQFELGGKGNLTIDCYASEGIGIGNDYDHGYGDITVDFGGTLEIISNSVESMCIGGGYNDDDSEINLRSGNVKIYMYSHNGLAVGSFNGDANIDIGEDCSMDITISGNRVTGIGSCKGIATISSGADITMSCTGAQAVGIGVLEDGEGSIYIRQGKIDMKMRSAKHSAIGAMKGSVNTKIRDAVITIDSEGDDVTGIGDAAGTGNVNIIDSEVSLVLNAGNPKDIGTESGDVQIQNSNVSSLVNNKRTTYASN